MQIMQDPECLLALACQREGSRHRRLHQGASGRELNRPLKCRRRFVEIAALLLHQPQNPICRREMRVQLDVVIALLESGIVILLVIIDASQVTSDDGCNWVERLGQQQLFVRLA